MGVNITVTLEEDPETGDLILPFTDEILNEVGWKEGDTLKWDVLDNGNIVLTKVEEESSIKE